MAENFVKNLALILVATVLILLVLNPQPVECQFGIVLNPCTLPECTARCKKILQDKFMSASCVKNSKGMFCLCLG
ncbi:hypothetical protein RIF29_10595 [Crotalaria pallida]|uniref:Uncharacterized protein n=1 Tax=Crotalaria pallida TaxID=3830 RepID=A0AAN9FVD9_CROPI